MNGYTWLTQASQEFLERDYLDGQTVDERVNEICNTAEELLNKPGFAKVFKENIQKGLVQSYLRPSGQISAMIVACRSHASAATCSMIPRILPTRTPKS